MWVTLSVLLLMGGRRKVDGQGHMAKASGAITERRGLLEAIGQRSRVTSDKQKTEEEKAR